MPDPSDDVVIRPDFRANAERHYQRNRLLLDRIENGDTTLTPSEMERAACASATRRRRISAQGRKP